MFTCLKLYNKNNTMQKKNHINALAKSWNRIFENNFAFFIFPKLQNLLHYFYLLTPSIFLLTYTVTYITSGDNTKYSIYIIINKRR